MTGRAGLGDVVARVLDQVQSLTGCRAAGASAVASRDGGWQLDVDVIEVDRIPATTSVLATYEVEADGSGTVTGYRRVRRFYRNVADGEG